MMVQGRSGREPGTHIALTWTFVLLAHFAGSGRGVVDLPAWALAYGVFTASVVAILASRNRHVAPEPPLEGPTSPAGRPSSPLHLVATAAQCVSLVLLVALVALAWTGSRSIGQNLAPLAVIGVYWLLGGWLSLVAGPFWQSIDPFAPLARLGAGRRERRVDIAPVAAPWWAPIYVLGSFAVVWIAWPAGDRPRNLALWLTVYGVAMAITAWRAGRRVLTAYDALPAALDLSGSVLWAARSRRRIQGPDDRRRVGLIAALLLGAIAVDRCAATSWYSDPVAKLPTAVAVLATSAVVAVATAAVLVAWRAVERPVEHRRRESRTFPLAAALAPAAATVLLARGLSIGLIQLQNLVVLASDPLSRGWNLFGTVYWQVSQEPISPLTRGILQAGVLLAGHVSSLFLVSRAATARTSEGRTSLRYRNAAWLASLPAMAVVSMAGIVWTLVLLGQ